MDPRAKKQVIIAIIFAAMVLIVALAVYFLFFSVAPTCSDNIKNQKEEGIDCGGPCQPCEIKNLKNIDILWVKALVAQAQNYDLVARVANVNQNHGSREFQYEFQLFDLNNNLIASKAGTTFILPREEKYIMEQKISAGNQVAKIKLNISQVNWEKIKDYTPPKIQVFDKKFEAKNEYPIFAQASAILKNSGYSAYGKIKIAIVLFDAKDEPLAVNVVNVDSLDAGQERYFSAPWFFSFDGQVTRVDIEPQINLFK